MRRHYRMEAHGIIQTGFDISGLVDDANIVMSECAGVLQYAQTIFEGLKAYTTDDGVLPLTIIFIHYRRLQNAKARIITGFFLL